MIHKARDCFKRAIELTINLEQLNNMGSVLKDMAEYKNAIYWLRKGAKQLQDNPAAYSNVLFTLVGYEIESNSDTNRGDKLWQKV